MGIPLKLWDPCIFLVFYEDQCELLSLLVVKRKGRIYLVDVDLSKIKFNRSQIILLT